MNTELKIYDEKLQLLIAYTLMGFSMPTTYLNMAEIISVQSTMIVCSASVTVGTLIRNNVIKNMA